MKDFESWYAELISNEIWFVPASLHHKPETFRSVANKVYMEYVGSESFPPIQVARVYVFNKLCKITPDKAKVDWTKKALEKAEVEKENEWKPASPEHVDKCVAEFDEMMKNSSMLNAMPRVGYKQSVEEGGWLPKKPAPYPTTSKEEAYVRQRHLEYVKRNYEPRTGQPLPTWIEESEFNLLYDNEML